MFTLRLIRLHSEKTSELRAMGKKKIEMSYIGAEAGPALRTGVIATSRTATSRLARSFIDVPVAADPARTSMRTTPGTRPDTGQPTDDLTVKGVGNGGTWNARTGKLITAEGPCTGGSG